MDFSDLFKQEEFSDALLVLKAPSCKRGRGEAAGEQQDLAQQQQELQVLCTIPAHSIILSRSPVLKAAAVPLAGAAVPLAGAGFRIYLLFRASDAGTTLSALCQQVRSSSKAATLVLIDIDFTLSLGPVSRSGTAVSATQGPIVHDGSVGWAGFPDFLQVGPMAGGWDKVAWANKGLPAAGKVDVRLKVSLVQDNQQGAPQAPADVE